MTDIPRHLWRCGNCFHYEEDGERPPKPYLWNCSGGNPTEEKSKRGPCPHWCERPLTDKDY